MVELDNIGKSKNPLEPAHHGGLMGKSLDILRNLHAQENKIQSTEGKQSAEKNISKKQVEVEVGNMGTMNTGDIVDGAVDLNQKFKSQNSDTPIIFNNGIYTIQKNLETATVKIDPAFKALVDSVCKS